MAASKIGLQAATSRGMKNKMVHWRLEPDRAEGTNQVSSTGFTKKKACMNQ